MTLLSLSFTLAFVAFAIVLSIRKRLGLEKDLVVASVRATVQLLVIGYVLKLVFSFNSPWFTFLMVAAMVAVAAYNAGKRAKLWKTVFWKVFVAIGLTETVTMAYLLVLHVLPVKPQYVIPVSGMIVGNAMVISSLFLNRLYGEVSNRKQEILLLLSLGGTPRQSIRQVLKDAVKASLIPTVDTMKTTGLVQLPGMMTGQIIAGADPIQAVRYQLLILFALLAAGAITSITLGGLVYPTLFNQHQQLKRDFE
ncbi:ABC transporter permease [Alicyclobacillus pomorum]|jgi:putative ABC transport system permease protein|uniref:ABC transporter permease n=1 Tax=Alicyclobacillus pomorum TaxID=204470 RepID=UPI0004010705|nr:iron export ABC transporter permease subunit FetB [Alicyclobacillus pomorum]